MWFIHVFVVIAVLQWSVVTGEGRTDQFTVSMCKLWEECVRTAVADDLSHAGLGTRQAICGDFVGMLEKHGVDCESLQALEEKTADVGRTVVSLEPPQGEENPKQESLQPADDQKDTNDGISYNRQPGNPDVPPSVKKLGPRSLLGRTNFFEDCSEIHTAYALVLGGVSVPSGVFSIKPANVNNPISVYCDQTTDGGGWTVIQRRFDGSLEFFRFIRAYRQGFGDVTGEQWLGLDNIHYITSQNAYELYIELEDWEGNVKYAKYSTFSVGPGPNDYILGVGGYSGTAGDGLGADPSTNPAYYINGAKFSTRDFDQDTWNGSNADRHGGGWWWVGNSYSNLNGPYFRDTDGVSSSSNGYGVHWFQFHRDWFYSLKKTKMMVRPTDFSTRMANMKHQ